MRGGIFNKAVSLSLAIQMALAVMPLGVQNVSAADSNVYLNDVFAYAQTKAVNDGKHWKGYKVVEGRSLRRYADETKIAEICRANGYKLSQIYKQTLIGITDMEKLMTKKRFRELLSDYIVKPKGKLTLVPVSDKREEVITLSEFKEES